MSRKVKTTKGAEFFEKPIGSYITPDGTPPRPQKLVTIERLNSLQRQLAVAIEMGNDDLAQQVRETFRADLERFGQGKTPLEIAQLLKE